MFSELKGIVEDKTKKESFITIFLLLLGTILLFIGAGTGTIAGVKVIDFANDSYRLVIIVSSFVFIVIGAISAFKGETHKKIVQELEGKLSIKEQEIDVLKKIISEKNDLPPLHTFHGLKPELRCDAVFQDFKINRGSQYNRNAVYYMWADTYLGNTIQASVKEEEGGFLQVIFNNNDDHDHWFSNISIHPISEQALDNQSTDKTRLKYRFLKIKARARIVNDKDLERIAIILRVCDRKLTYWEYASSPSQCKQLLIEIGEWQNVVVDLSNNIQWQQFKSDGNRENNSLYPDFSVISGVTIVLGGYNNRSQNPIYGKGVIDIYEVFLDNNP